MSIDFRHVVATIWLIGGVLYLLRKLVPGIFWRSAMGYQDRHDFEMAERSLLKALAIETFVTRLTRCEVGQAHVRGSLGFLYQHQHRFEEAARMLESALRVFSDAHQPNEFAPILGGLGHLYFESGDFAKAAEYLRQAQAVYQHLPGRDDAKQEIARLLALSSAECRDS